MIFTQDLWLGKFLIKWKMEFSNRWNESVKKVLDDSIELTVTGTQSWILSSVVTTSLAFSEFNTATLAPFHLIRYVNGSTCGRRWLGKVSVSAAIMARFAALVSFTFVESPQGHWFLVTMFVTLIHHSWLTSAWLVLSQSLLSPLNLELEFRDLYIQSLPVLYL